LAQGRESGRVTQTFDQFDALDRSRRILGPSEIFGKGPAAAAVGLMMRFYDCLSVLPLPPPWPTKKSNVEIEQAGGKLRAWRAERGKPNLTNFVIGALAVSVRTSKGR